MITRDSFVIRSRQVPGAIRDNYDRWGGLTLEMGEFVWVGVVRNGVYDATVVYEATGKQELFRMRSGALYDLRYCAKNDLLDEWIRGIAAYIKYKESWK